MMETRNQQQQVSIPGLTLLHGNSTVSSALKQNTTFLPNTGSESQKAIQLHVPAKPTRKEKKDRKSKYALRKEYEGAAREFRNNHSPSNLSPNIKEGKRSPRSVPSSESGGVPNPTPLYLAQSFAPPSSFSRPRQILVIMDLNGTLLYRPSKRRPFDFVERPCAKRFLSYCIDTFTVCIWSSARPQNVHKMVEQLLTPEQRAKCVVTWARDKFGLSAADYDSRVQCYKRLTRVWKDPVVMASHPNAANGGQWDQSNTVLVDDSMEKGRSEPHNILQIPDFMGMENEPPLVLPQVHDYLNTLCYQTDISRFIRQAPFKLDSTYRLPPPPESGFIRST